MEEVRGEGVPDAAAAPPPVEGGPEDSGRQDGYAEVGSRVASVLNAAEEAAEQIRADARRSADDIRRQAEIEARRYANERRQQADFEARRVVAEAHVQAQSIVEAARATGRQLEEAGLAQQERFRIHTVALEKRVERALDGLRSVTNQLQHVVLDAAPGSTAGPELEDETHELPTLAELPGRAGSEKAWHRIGLALTRRAKVAEGEAELAPEPTVVVRRAASHDPAGTNVYETLKGSVEKVGDRWVAKSGDRPEGEADGAEAAGNGEGSDDLYERAKRLGIRGRTKMSREELAQAVAAAEAGGSPS